MNFQAKYNILKMLLDDDRSILHTYYINLNLRQPKDKCENFMKFKKKGTAFCDSLNYYKITLKPILDLSFL